MLMMSIKILLYNNDNELKVNHIDFIFLILETCKYWKKFHTNL